MRPRFHPGEIVVFSDSPVEGVVDDIEGPTDDGSSWAVLVRITSGNGRNALVTRAEDALEPTGLCEDESGARRPVATLPVPDERRDMVVLHLVTDIIDGIEAARAADQVERTLLELAVTATVETEAERHWGEPYAYEFEVTVVPDHDPVALLQRIADAGGEGWLACRDDGWGCTLWWSADDDESVFLAPGVCGAEVTLLPWNSPTRRPEDERPIVDVDVDV